MTMKRWDGAAYIDLSVAKRWDGATWIDLTVAKRWDGTSWIDIALPGGGGGSLSATANPGVLSSSFHDGSASPPLAKAMNTDPTTVTATGGTGGGPTYSWARLSGSASITPTAPSSATTAFASNVFLNGTRSAVFRCTIVRGAETVHVDVGVSLTYTGNTPL